MRQSNMTEGRASIYLDHAATTQLDTKARFAMAPLLDQRFGNPSSVHESGRYSRLRIDEARERIAAILAAHPSEVVFTSGGTESDNSAIRGAIESSGGGHVVTTSIEHEAVLETCRALERGGIHVTYVAPDRDGIVTVQRVRDAIRPDTALISVMLANNEIGTIQPAAEIGAICRERHITFHCDAVQAAGALSIDVQSLNVDLMSLSGHKFHGPQGIGILYVRTGTAWTAQQLGGGQERGRRSGTENVAGIVGMSVALSRAEDMRQAAVPRLKAMRNFLFESLLTGDTQAVANGSLTARLPGNVNVSFPGLSGEALIIALDQAGICASSGSACSSGSIEPSHVLTALGASKEVTRSAVRLTVGRDNSWDEIQAAAAIILNTVHRLRSHQQPTKARPLAQNP
jgi:cysteine desulfurase